MRVITATVAQQVQPQRRRVRAANIELLGLIACTVVVLFGVGLAYGGRVARLSESATGASATGLVSVRTLTSPGDLEPVLTMIPSAYERQFVARALYQRAMADDPRLEHVGGLAFVTVPAATVRADPRLTQLRSRLDRRPAATAVPVLVPVDVAAIKPGLLVRTIGEFNVRVAGALALLLGAFWGAHLLRRWRGRDDDPVLLPVVLLLSGVGLMTMLALRDPLRDTIAAEAFALGGAAGVLVLLLVSEVDFEASRWRNSVVLPLVAALALATLLLLFGSGPGSSGVKVNLLGAQPVEAIRLLIVLALAAFFGRRVELLRALSEPATPTRPWLRYLRLPRWKDVRPILVSMALVLAFFFLQKDLGPALVLTCVFLAMYGIGRGHAALVTTGFALLLCGFAVAYWIGEPATVRQRVLIWADPWNNAVPGGNQIAHGLWALSTGAIFGSGVGLGSPQTIPAGHTDFVLAAVGEELGFTGLVAVVLLYALLGWRCLRVALRAPGDYSAFLAVGVALALVVQALVIAGGLLGLVPLSGVVTPFLSFGRSSMLANCAGVGIVLAIARRRGAERMHLRTPIRALAGVLLAAAVVLSGRAAWVQVVRADELATAPSLTPQADTGYRFEHNPRLLAVARTLERGTIYDRHGLPLATSRGDERASLATRYRAAGVQPADECDGAGSRCYPLGGVAFHVLGDWNNRTNWGARNASYLERDGDTVLKGFDDRARVVEVTNPTTDRREYTIARDYQELLPLVRQQYWPRSSAATSMQTRNRDLHSSLDARLQMRVASILRERIEAGGHRRGAAVVLDVSTGEVLASVSYPWPGPADLQPSDPPDADESGGRLFDRPRYGLYPPGSVFKLLVSAAALQAGASDSTFSCVRLPDGRVGNFIRGTARPVRDDPLNTVPHGKVGLHDGLVLSCNAYFAQLAQRLGPKPLLDAAAAFQIDAARSPTPAGLQPSLAHAGYGQGQVVASPLKIARISASIAAGGTAVPPRWVPGPAGPVRESSRFLSAPDAARLARSMRDVVTRGTGRAVRAHPVPIAAKTGTAEVSGAPAHAWFTGFAPYGGGERQIAFAVLIENAGYGGRVAAPIGGDIVTAARELGLIK